MSSKNKRMASRQSRIRERRRRGGGARGRGAQAVGGGADGTAEIRRGGGGRLPQAAGGAATPSATDGGGFNPTAPYLLSKKFDDPMVRDVAVIAGSTDQIVRRRSARARMPSEPLPMYAHLGSELRRIGALTALMVVALAVLTVFLR